MRFSGLVVLSLSLLLAGCGKSAPTKTAKSGSNNSDLKGGSKTDGGKTPKLTDKTPVTPEFAKSADDEYALRREQFEAGWIKLFDGKTTFGWTANSDANWRVENGVLVADKCKAGLLVTDVPFADYELKCDFRLAKGGNSGIFLRTAFNPTDPAKDCYELNMCDTHKTHATGSLVARKVADVKTTREGEWQSFHVVLHGKRITVKLDDKQVLDFTDDTPNFLNSGFLGLQFREGKIEFRSVLLKPLGTESLFNGKDLSGWTTVPGGKGLIAIAATKHIVSGVLAGDAPGGKKETVVKTLLIKGGPAFLQTDAKYGDFILQADVRANAKDSNSGIFFRAMTGTAKAPSNGYEMQLQNTIKDGDRTKPDDYQTGYGTGAIFRFQKVRRVIPNDNEWFTVTLIAHGNRIASWVNGYQVTDWNDTRKPNENPRRGKRTDAGHFILQGHDPTTHVSFRNLRVATYPAK